MQNYDEQILRSRRLDPQAPYPLLHQAVRIALFDEYAARSFYRRVIEAFGSRPPFTEILNSEERHIAALSGLCEQLGVARPLDPFPAETSTEPTWLANCSRAVAGEVAKVRLYNALLPVVIEPEARSVFLNLQASAYERHLPAFREAVLSALDQERYHAAMGVSPQQAYVKHGPFSDFIERALVQVAGRGGMFGLLSPLLRNSHPALLTGLAVGGTGVYLLKKKSGRGRREN
ncbi:ferritin-like domain-containing protein [Azomonas macrocytogenes]|uniref:Rubrerythrin n=1 Tax=Azomonas macrocytogenes TaxID=69962 RepID=A0A839T2F0_AZOMA|nr:ferritin [Azomonas macrocytogenes]MBB3103159.1 rubrerythrin [Azomonas macrocytogenes]